MAFGKCRFLYNNLLRGSSATVTASSTKTGAILNSLKDGTGSAVMTTGGTYTADTDLEYTIEIDSVAGGAEVTQATFKWRTNISTGWEATGVATATTAITLNNGVTVQWTGGAGADFVLGDTWYFKTINRFSTVKLYDCDRDSVYRSANAMGTITFVIDLATAQTFNSFILLDHNLTNAATITLEANATDSWGAPSFSEAVTWASSKILHYTASDQLYRYIRVSITDGANPDNYIEISEMFAGVYFEPSKTFDPSHGTSINTITTSERNRYGTVRKRFHNNIRTFTGTLRYLTSADNTSFETMLNTITDREAETIIPVYFNADALDTSDFFLMEFEGLNRSIPLNANGSVYYNIALNMSELPRSID